MVNVDIKKQQSKINKKTFDFVNQMAPDLWSQAQVLKWLIYKNLPALIPTFKTHNIDGFLMLSLDTDILINGIIHLNNLYV